MPRKTRAKPQSTAPNDGSPLGSLSDAELIQELARRRAATGKLDLSSMELATEETKREIGAETLAAMVAELPSRGRRSEAVPEVRPTRSDQVPTSRAQDRDALRRGDLLPPLSPLRAVSPRPLPA